MEPSISFAPMSARMRPMHAGAALSLLIVAAAASVLLRAPTGAGAQAIGDGRGGVKLHKIGTFNKPVYVTQPKGVRRLLFVVEHPGKIRVIRNGHKLSQPFLNITGRVNFDSEQGLLSMAFDPNYRTNRRFYVYFTNNNGDNEVDEFKRSTGSATHANASSRRRVLYISHPFAPNHNGGQLQFGPDGYLYISTGDGGNGDDEPQDQARKKTTLLGKILRIIPRPRPGKPHGIPAGNPFADGPGGNRDEIYSYGLRNPWRFSFDRISGRRARLVIADVGQSQREEVDYVTRSGARGANFGWPEFEGTLDHDLSRPGTDPPVGPIHEYTHADGCAITGGYVVRDARLGTLYRRYLYGDYCAGQLRSLVPHLNGATRDRALGPTVSHLSSFGEDRAGHLYAASHYGPVYRLDPR